MRISYWSSDVLSSDLEAAAKQLEPVGDIPVEVGGEGLELVGQEGRAIAEFRQFERRRIVDPGAEAEQRIFHVRIVVMIAGRVGVVERQRRFDRNIGLRLRTAAEQIGLEAVGQPQFEPARKQAEIGRSEEKTSE